MKASSSVDTSLKQVDTLLAGGSKLEGNDLEKQDLCRILAKMPNKQDPETVQKLMGKLFSIAAGKMHDEHDKQVLAGLSHLVAVAQESLLAPKPRYIDAFFFPEPENVFKLIKYIKMAKRSLRICVFNLTNNDIANAILDVWNSGADVRIITDDECMKNKGSDITFLASKEIPVRTDSSEQNHMHNKFVIVDDSFLITGSFNWTFQAGASNQENLLVVDHPYYLEKYAKEFDKLWRQFSGNVVDQADAARTIQQAFRSKKQNYGKGKPHGK